MTAVDVRVVLAGAVGRDRSREGIADALVPLVDRLIARAHRQGAADGLREAAGWLETDAPDTTRNGTSWLDVADPDAALAWVLESLADPRRCPHPARHRTRTGRTAMSVSSDIDRARNALHEMRVEYAEMVAEASGEVDAETRFLLALLRLLELAIDDAAVIEGMNERTRQRAERIGGDDHTWVMHRPEWATALHAVTAWEAAHVEVTR